MEVGALSLRAVDRRLLLVFLCLVGLPCISTANTDNPSRTMDADVAEAAAPSVYDPFDGIDENGRIPRVQLPEDIEHPERWRYIPEGRIKPGNVCQRLLVSSFIAPFI